MAGTSTQPSQVSTEDTPSERPPNVVTDDTMQPSAADDGKPTAAPDGKTPGQTSGDSAKPGDDKQKPTRDRSAERRIDRLTKKLSLEQGARQQDQARIQKLEEEIESLKSAQPAAKPEKMPDIKDFDTPELYAEAYAGWKAKQTKPGDKGKPDRSTAKPTSTGKKADGPPPPDAEDLKKFKDDGVAKLGDDFLEAYQNPNDIAVNPAMGDYILDSEVGAELYVWLYNNPDDAKKLFLKSETAMVRRFEKLEKQIKEHGSWDFEAGGKTADRERGKKPQANGADADGGKDTGKSRRSKAPDPPGEPDRGTVQAEGDLEAADMDDYAATRRAQIAKNRGRLLM